MLYKCLHLWSIVILKIINVLFSLVWLFILVSDFIDKGYNIGCGAFPAHIYIGRWTLAYGISDSK